MIDHLIVVDNDHDDRVRDLTAGQSVPTTYLGSVPGNLGGGEDSHWECCTRWHSAPTGFWLADDDGRPRDAEVLTTLLDCAHRWTG